MAVLIKMECYTYLICFALFTSVTSLNCYNHDPFSINGTQPPSVLRCPKGCICKYCETEKNMTLKYKHNVNCSNLKLDIIPSKNTVPTDVAYYLLDKNNIISLQNNSFNTSKNVLEYLLLDHNNLEHMHIESNAFRGMGKLRYISMNNNKYLNELRAVWFADLVSLELLHLQNCGINRIDSESFKNCKHLKKVDISHNSMVTFPTSLFRNLPSLMYLFIHNNKLYKLPNQAFVGSSFIHNITFNDNSLTTINENVGFQTLGQLQTITLSYNRFLCDCNLVWLRNWIGKTNITTFQDMWCTKCTYGQRKVVIKLLDFDPDTLQCSTVIRVLRTIIPYVSVAVAIVIITFLLYYFRYDLRYWNQQRRLRKQYEQINKQGPPPINGENIKYDAFVAYNSKDQHWIISVLQPSLEIDRNFKLCVDYRDFIAGEAVVNNIANAVKCSRKVLLVISKHFIKSEWCYFELEMARMRMFDNHEDILVVAVLEKVSAKDMPILLHKILTTKTYIKWEEHPEGQALFWAKLEASLLSPNCPKHRLLDNARE